ncbi:MAG: rhodanese-like domain-containing protein [Saprospiraceae bacterium]|nr:rhodanese-like domain-containing protein [Saprospiraceae bacterium]
MDLANVIKTNNAVVVDVRSRGEYLGGHVVDSINIPLDEIPARWTELKQIEKPIILCCASGNRSGQATRFLLQQGMSNVHNGGSWFDVNFYKNN